MLSTPASPVARPSGAILRLIADPVATATREGLAIELCNTDAVAAHQDAWTDLIARALEPNVFLEPAFALAAARHFRPLRRLLFILVWRSDRSGDRCLIGLCPVHDGGTSSGPVTSVWTHEQATLSAPLLDRTHGSEALAALLAWLARERPEAATLLLRNVPLEGACGQLLRNVAGTRFAILDRRTRAILPRADREGAVALSSRRAKELRRQRRRLADGGDLVYGSAGSEAEVRVATERFLDLEARGWKGAKGTALAQDPGLATFARTMTRLLARDGQCRIDSLDLDGRAAAMAIVLRSGDRAYFWKTAYDETLASRSPGKQLALALTERQAADATVALTDSCAVQGHPMIDRLWPERMTVGDVLVASPDLTADAFERTRRQMHRRVLCRRWLKAAWRLGRPG